MAIGAGRIRQKSTLDPGLGEKYTAGSGRAINRDGSYNVIRKGGQFHSKDLYQKMINISWGRFFLIIVAGYIFVNLLFASLYYLIGSEHITSVTDSSSPFNTFINVLFFSVQTFTTVGYGGMVPKGWLTNIVASLEAMTGLMGFALATGLLYGRFSKPSARLQFSKNALMTFNNGKYALHFRIANMRENMLIELEAKILAIVSVTENGEELRKYYPMNLERDSVYLIPMNWTLVHPIDEESPLYGRTKEELEQMKFEMLVMIKAFDDTFSQTVHTRFSYRFDEIVWGAKFKRPYFVDDNHQMVFEIDKLSDYEQIQLPGNTAGNIQN